jgi:hypothetical protein
LARACHHSGGAAVGTLGILLADIIFTHRHFMPQVFILLNLNGIFSVLSGLSMANID